MTVLPSMENPTRLREWDYMPLANKAFEAVDEHPDALTHKGVIINNRHPADGGGGRF